MKRLTLILISLCLLTVNADAASRFWVGGTGTWDGVTTTHWSATTGGANGASVPTTTDTVTLDGASGGGTVTVNTTVTVQSITSGSFTGTLDFSANNNNVTLTAAAGWAGSGAGVRTINLGNGTFTLTTPAVWTMTVKTNLTFAANGSTIKFAGNTTGYRTFTGSNTYNNLVIDTNTSLGPVAISGSNTFNNILANAPTKLTLTSGGVTTATSLTMAGTSSNQISLVTDDDPTIQSTLSVASGTQTLSWIGVRAIAFTGGATFIGNNAFDLGRNSGITFAGSSACIIGGWLLWRDMPDHINDNFPAWIEKAA